MKKLLFLSYILFLFVGCNNKDELTKENLQGTWKCFNFTMEGENIDNSIIEMTKQYTLQTIHTFKGDTLLMDNSMLPLAFYCTFNFPQKQITCSPIGFRDVQARTYTVIDFTGNELVLQEKVQGITATTYLKKDKE